MNKQTIELNEYTAAYMSVGDGIPVILLHGFFGDAETLGSIASTLASNYCCISLELLGFGDSSKPDLRYVIGDQVAFLKEFLTAKQISKFYLIGYSYGSWVAAAYAVDRHDLAISTPDLLGMVLLAPAGIRDDSFVGRYDHLRPLFWQTPLIDLVLNSIAPLMKLMGREKSFETIQTARHALMTQPAARSFLLDRLEPEDAIDTVEKDIDRIDTPTLVIAGEIDGTIPFWHAQTYAEKIPHASIVIIPAADHDLVQTHSQEVSESIVKYWNQSASI
ncbi:alpha/beta hydrolase [Chamaesiphon sp. GL140_3_metabinner_50]|uniref:alpha/beta fold hydrolase n=1 Tax=Chamaesiphon sp. GL140_3_metabinner_50 TaxID=2970812 RepID=UPI0025E74EE3|nr:alpha/beta hydrolase [Chamaesiphon sp. GL140_3_metabinner_50]